MIVPSSAHPLLMAQAGDPLDELGKIERSLRARASASGNMVRLFSAGGNRKTFTLNDWVKWNGQTTYLLVADSVSPGMGGDWGLIQITSNGQFAFSTTANNTSFVTTRLLRDPGAHYNINVAIDTTQAALADRVKISVNNELAAGSWSGAGIAQNADTYFMAARNHSMFRLYDGINTYYSGGQSAARVVVDGQALPPTAFGQYHPRTGQWRPKTKAAIRAAVAAAGGVRNGWGVNGVFLTYDDTSSVAAIGYDRSQSDTDTTGNNWTLTNINVTTAGPTYDSLTDTPTNNFCTLNPLNPARSTLSNGNLTASGSTDLPTIIPTSGNWFFEIDGVAKTWTPPAAFPAAAGNYNFGQRPLSNSIPGGYKTLCTKNLPLSDTITLSGSFTGNLSADGPCVFMNGCPETLTINGNAVTFGTHADRLANGFKIRTASSSYNNSGTNTWSATILSPSIKSLFRFQNARSNP